MAGVKRNWTDKELALKYLYKLGPAYSGLLLNLNAQQNMGNDYFPKTVRLAQSMAARHLVQELSMYWSMSMYWSLYRVVSLV